YREGLSVSLLEAMASGLPVICSEIRGNSDLISNGKGGFLAKPNDVDSFADYIKKIFVNNNLISMMKEENRNKVEAYSIENVLDMYGKIITKLMERGKKIEQNSHSSFK